MEEFKLSDLPKGYRLAEERHIGLFSYAVAEIFADAKYPIPVLEIDHKTLLKLKFETFKEMVETIIKKGYVIFEENFIANITLIPYADLKPVSLDKLSNIIKSEGYEEASKNFIETFNRIDEVESTLKLREGTMYVNMFAVQTAIQGKGYGKRLMKFIMDECEKNKRDLFLFTNTKKNEEIYNHFGFKTIMVDDKPKTGYTAFLLKENYGK